MNDAFIDYWFEQLRPSLSEQWEREHSPAQSIVADDCAEEYFESDLVDTDQVDDRLAASTAEG